MRNIFFAAALFVSVVFSALPAAAQANFGSQPVGSAPTYPNGTGGLDMAKGFVFVAPPASQPAGCKFLGSVGCPVYVSGGGGGAATLAAGSVAAGAYVSGSLLSGAVVDLTNIETTAGGSAPPKAASVQGIVGGTPISVNANTFVAPATTAATVTTGLSFQTACAQNASRVQCRIANPTSATEPLLVFDGASGPSVNASLYLGPGAVYFASGNGSINTNAIQVTATTTGHTFSVSGS